MGLTASWDCQPSPGIHQAWSWLASCLFSSAVEQVASTDCFDIQNQYS